MSPCFERVFGSMKGRLNAFLLVFPKILLVFLKTFSIRVDLGYNSSVSFLFFVLMALFPRSRGCAWVFYDSMFVSLRPRSGFLRLLIFGFSGSRFRVVFFGSVFDVFSFIFSSAFLFFFLFLCFSLFLVRESLTSL